MRGSAASPVILVVEDDERLAELMGIALGREGYEVLVARDGVRGLERFRTEHPDLVILDLMLPRLSGLDVCRILRAESAVPILMVTGKDGEADKVSGLEVGADDYVTKPFSLPELVSRVRAHLRRSRMGQPQPPAHDVLAGGPVELDSSRHEVRVRGKHVAFTPKEFQLLVSFLEGRGRLRTREFLISEVWGPEYFGDTKTLDVHVKRLRQKIERDPQNPEHLVTVRGLGYRFLDEPLPSPGSGGMRLSVFEARATARQ
ncbi:MAG TPA: response regulator transcription factor [Candidatus Angelobacter sp.]|nr:response regulator transcription factor [Candidatus Angelobacter sp.]